MRFKGEIMSPNEDRSPFSFNHIGMDRRTLLKTLGIGAVSAAALPMLAAGAGAVVIASLVRSPPIYDDLRERMLRADKAAKQPPSTQ